MQGWSAVSIFGRSEANLTNLGKAISYGVSEVPIKIGTSEIENGESLLLPLTDFGAGSQVQVKAYDWIRQPAFIEVRGVVPVDPAGVPSDPARSTGNEGGDSPESEQRNSLLEFVPVPSAEGMVIGSGLAVFTAGTVERSPSGSDPRWERYDVSVSQFWQLGARSSQSFTEGRVRFWSGVGRGIYGFASSFPRVDYRSILPGFYVNGADDARVLDLVDGTLRTAAYLDWNPGIEVGMILEAGVVSVQFRSGNNWQTVYTSPNQLTGPTHFCAVLGPLAFLYGATHDG